MDAVCPTALPMVPRLSALPQLAADDALDSNTLSFLHRMLKEAEEVQEKEAKEVAEKKAKKVEMEERRMARISRHVAAGIPVSAEELAAWERWIMPDPLGVRRRGRGG